MADKAMKGRAPSGDRHPSRLHPERFPRGMDRKHSKLTDDTVREIREQYDRGVKISVISRAVKHKWHAVANAARRISWKHVT